MNMGVNQNLPPYENPFYVMPAQTRIKSEMATGKIYAYKTKPKIVPIIKMICCLTIALLAITELVMAIFIFMANGY